MKLESLQDKHKKDKIIFLVGAGSSIKDINLNLLKKYIVMAVNSGIVGVPFSQYFVSDDIGVSSWSYFKELSKLKCINLLYKNKLEKYSKHLDSNKTVFYNHKSWYSPEKKKYNLPDGLQLTSDITKPIVGARIGMGSCIHLAYAMGGRVIVLLGNDCQLSKDGKQRRYFWQYWDKLKQPYRISGPKFNEKTQNLGFDQQSYVNYWNHFCKVNKNLLEKKLRIIDCSNSVLNCFEKKPLEQVLKEYD